MVEHEKMAVTHSNVMVARSLDDFAIDYKYGFWWLPSWVITMVIEVRIPGNAHIPSVIQELQAMARKEGLYFSGTYPTGTFKGPGFRGHYICEGEVLRIDLSPFFAEVMARSKINSIMGSLQSIKCA